MYLAIYGVLPHTLELKKGGTGVWHVGFCQGQGIHLLFVYSLNLKTACVSVPKLRFLCDVPVHTINKYRGLIR